LNFQPRKSVDPEHPGSLIFLSKLPECRYGVYILHRNAGKGAEGVAGGTYIHWALPGKDVTVAREDAAEQGDWIESLLGARE
jgi:hypothetical protein